jgi:hypothetical protein
MELKRQRQLRMSEEIIIFSENVNADQRLKAKRAEIRT